MGQAPGSEINMSYLQSCWQLCKVANLLSPKRIQICLSLVDEALEFTSP